ncbi:hypothetical protein B0A55_13481 [Friedmanniomyces simplex]|uniref:Uncharacterized protein n=1 Tax=Friedmanniomyces simplex TaxID=329884 RepID=A0A4U0VD04_9PEZI|nr:hypothetical protein B0A55_13481 [Friedmanniomyces simplex]
MRTMIRHEELLLFMKILRIVLLEGGRHKKYVQTDGDDTTSGNSTFVWSAQHDYAPNDQAVGHVSLLMNCAIDAIGLGSWLEGQLADEYRTSEFMQELGTKENHLGKVRPRPLADDVALARGDRVLPTGCKAQASKVGG